MHEVIISLDQKVPLFSIYLWVDLRIEVCLTHITVSITSLLIDVSAQAHDNFGEHHLPGARKFVPVFPSEVVVVLLISASCHIKPYISHNNCLINNVLQRLVTRTKSKLTQDFRRNPSPPKELTSEISHQQTDLAVEGWFMINN